MDYPNGFETPAFPAGKRIAVSRALSVWIGISFFLIVCLCGLLIWVQRSVRVHPFLVSINDLTGQWEIVGHSHTRIKSISAIRTLQESVIGKFLENWYRISDDRDENLAVWQSCDRATQCTGYGTAFCALYCVAGAAVYDGFIQHIVPDYQTRIANGEQWALNMSSLNIVPVGTFNATGGMWQVSARLESSVSGDINIVGYARVARDVSSYPQTMGYYVVDYNAYKVN